MTKQEALALLDEMFFFIQSERDRIFIEASGLQAMRTTGCAAAIAIVGISLGNEFCKLDVGQLETRASTLLTMVNSIEELVRRIPNIEQAVTSGDPARVRRIVDGVSSVLAVLDDTSGLSDLLTDLQILAKDIIDDINKLAKRVTTFGGGFGLGVGAAVVAGLVIVVAART